MYRNTPPQKYLCIVFLCILCTIFFHCTTQAKITDPDSVQNVEIRLADDNQELVLEEYILANNIWNKGDITDYTQAAFKVTKEHVFPLGWEWDWPRSNNQVKAYPEIIHGFKPWKKSSTTAALPVRISDIKEIKISYDIVQKAAGEYNLAFDIWITRDPVPNGENIVCELMIWIDKGTMHPGGSFVEKTVIDDEEYYFYAGKVSHARWTYLAFTKTSAEYRGETNIHKFTDYLARNNHISASEYLSAIELGNEIVHGAGKTIINEYIVSVK